MFRRVSLVRKETGWGHLGKNVKKPELGKLRDETIDEEAAETGN